MAKWGGVGNAQTIAIKLKLPEELYDLYAERATLAGKDPEHEILKTLSFCRDHRATQPIYLDDQARNELSQLSGFQLRDPSDLITWARLMVTLRVAGVDVPLDTRLIKRLETRRFGTPWADFVRRVVIDELERYAGLR